VQPGTYTLTISGTGGSPAQTKSTSVSLVVTLPAKPAAPTITGKPANPTNQTGATFSFTVSSLPPGGFFRCTLDSNPPQTCLSGVGYSNLAQGTHSFSVVTVDGYGQTSSPASYQWVVDTSAPTITISEPAANGVYNNLTWLRRCVNMLVTGVCGTSSDALSTVTATNIAIKRNSDGLFWNGSSFAATTISWRATSGSPTSWYYTFTPPGDGSYTVLVQAADNAGNTTLPGAEPTAGFRYDTTAPLTTLTTIPVSADGSNGWFQRSSVQFTLSASDTNGSGVAASYYTIDGGSQQTYTAAVTIASQGDHTVSYWSVDYAGNSEGQHTAHIKLDNQLPTSTLSLSASPNANGWYTSHPSFSLSASDPTPGSGVAGSFYRLDGGDPTPYSSPVMLGDGQHTISYWSTDKAGNSESAKSSGTIKVDTVKPATMIAVSPADPDGDNRFYKTTPSFTLSASDPAPASGVAASYYRIDGGQQQSYPGHAVTIPDGQHTISYWSVDTAGNSESTRTTDTIKVDTVPPPLPQITSGPADGTSHTEASFSFTDSESGVSLRCQLDSGGSSACSSPTSYSDLTIASHSFQVLAVDQAGNKSTPASYSWQIKVADFDIAGSVGDLLYPGVSKTIPLTLTNPNDSTIYVTGLSVSIDSSSLPSGCPASNFAITQSNASSTNSVEIPAKGSVTIPATGLNGVTAPKLTMLDLATAQDDCQNATFTLSYGGSAHS
jgi:hypothetical protein